MEHHSPNYAYNSMNKEIEKSRKGAGESCAEREIKPVIREI
jgi:hypothetical protein